MADIITFFQETSPSLDSYWRSVILFGRNVASYKFALAKSLLEIAPASGGTVTLDALADPFSRHHVQFIKIQAYFCQAIYNYGSISRLLRACLFFP